LLLLAPALSPAHPGQPGGVRVTRGSLASDRNQGEWDALLAVLRAPGLRQPTTTEAAYAAVAVGQVGIITTLYEQISQWPEVVNEHSGGTRWLITSSASRVSGGPSSSRSQ
jgi:hypothetical protein